MPVLGRLGRKTAIALEARCRDRGDQAVCRVEFSRQEDGKDFSGRVAWPEGFGFAIGWRGREAFRVERYQALDGVARNAGTVDDGAPRESLKASAPKRAVKRRAAGGPYS